MTNTTNTLLTHNNPPLSPSTTSSISRSAITKHERDARANTLRATEANLDFTTVEQRVAGAHAAEEVGGEFGYGDAGWDEVEG